MLDRGFIPPDSRTGIEFNSPALRSFTVRLPLRAFVKVTVQVDKDKFDSLLGWL